MLLNQITIPCTDYGASVDFYTRLGLTQIVDAPPRYARFESPTGEGATLSIHETEGPAPPGFVIYFDHATAEELDSHVEELLERGFEFKSMPTDRSWGWREARLVDPADNEICLMHAGRNRRFPDWRIASK
ncbi:VOC family protein [Erythrobacter sp. GH1-10]|uniref:VOC family protein n=1 Tax=Erythrobacter sp. GH1-10 TaxID=3349334 RepID=UPI0038779B6B